MKIITINGCRQAGTYDFKGLSTDEKPTNCGINSLFYELDTGDFYYFDGVWKKVSSKVQLQDTGPSGTIEITENGTVDVTDYDYADVNVPGVIPTGTLPITENGNVNVTNYATTEVDVDYVTVDFDLPALARSTPTALSQARYYLAATNIGGYALFGGGYTSSSFYSAVVDAYDSSLTRSTPTALSQARNNLAATTVAPAGGSSPQSGYALFGGGTLNVSPFYSTVVDAYDTSLTRTTPTGLSTGRSYLAATNIGGYALFGGGISSSSDSAVVDAYDTSLTRTTPTKLSRARAPLAATSVAPAGGSSPQSGYALFGGGGAPSYSTVVDAYDTSLTRTTPTGLSTGRNGLAATNIGNYALFGGGYASSYSDVVDAYDTSLTRTTPTELSQARTLLAATSVAPAGGSSPQSGYALFGGGAASSSDSAVVDAYDTSLTRTTPTGLSTGRSNLAATSVGNYALFGGGRPGSNSSVVDAYSSASYDIQVFPDTKYNFNNSGEILSPTMQTITMGGPVVGYMKIKNTTVT